MPEDCRFRVGQGYDVHPLAPGRRLMLGGIAIPTEDNRGTLGHSDGDPLLHAVIDAILGSKGLGDIGQWFPDSDPQWKDADSTTLLKTLLQNEGLRNWTLVNLDCTVILAKPKLADHLPKIQENLARLLNTTTDRIAIKAKSNNGIASIGQGDAVAAMITLLASV